MAAVMQLPFILIIENNQFAYSTPIRRQFAAQKLSDRASGYGIPGVTIDGTSVSLVYETCRKDGGPEPGAGRDRRSSSRSRCGCTAIPPPMMLPTSRQG